MRHVIEIFSGGCYLCQRTIKIIETGKCYGCKMIVYDLNNVNEEIAKKIKEYKINSVPTIIIDGKIKIVGLPSFPWICDNEFYKYLEKNFSIK